MKNRFVCQNSTMVDAREVIMVDIDDETSSAEIMFKNNINKLTIKFQTVDEATEFVREIYKRGGRR